MIGVGEAVFAIIGVLAVIEMVEGWIETSPDLPPEADLAEPYRAALHAAIRVGMAGEVSGEQSDGEARRARAETTSSDDPRGLL
jgi:hypothetical protein